MYTVDTWKNFLMSDNWKTLELQMDTFLIEYFSQISARPGPWLHTTCEGLRAEISQKYALKKVSICYS